VTSSKCRISGVIASLVTPFDKRGRLDEATLAQQVEFVLSHDVDGICVLGGTGEPSALTLDEALAVVDVASSARREGTSLVVGALVGDSRGLMRVAQQAALIEADALMVTAPTFIRPTRSEVHQHVRAVAQGAAIDVIFFNVPSRTGVKLSTRDLQNLMRSMPRLVGVKESSRDLAQLSTWRRLFPDMIWLQGVDALYLPSLSIGAHGGLLASAAVVPELCVKMTRAFQAGDFALAMELHSALDALATAIFAGSHPGGLKYAMAVRGLDSGQVRSPLGKPSSAQKRSIDQSLAAMPGLG